MKKEQSFAKLLNALVMGKNFDDKDLDNYLYASLSQPPIKIIDKCNSDDELNYIVECPNCGEHVKYGEHTYTLSGYIYCDTENCKDNLIYKHNLSQYK